MNDSLMKRLKYFEEVCAVKAGKHFLRAFVWSMVNFFLVFQPDSVLKMVVYFVTVVAICWQLLAIGYFYGQFKITDRIHKAATNFPENELVNRGSKDEK